MVEINNLTTNPVDEEFLRKVAEKVLKEENKKEVAETSSHLPERSEGREMNEVQRTPPRPASRGSVADLSIALVGQGRIRELNKKYKKKNRVTDVLAFSNKEFGLGEIVVCLREVKKNAKIYGSAFEKELSRVLIHGILHLLGENHEKSEEQAKKMEVKENRYLKIIFNKV